MIKVIKYIAKDGKEFTNEYECIKYEIREDAKKFGFKVLDKNGDPIEDILSYELYEKADAVFVYDHDTLDLVNRIKEEIGLYSDIDNIGIWKLDEKNNQWINNGFDVPKYA